MVLRVSLKTFNFLSLFICGISFLLFATACKLFLKIWSEESSFRKMSPSIVVVGRKTWRLILHFSWNWRRILKLSNFSVEWRRSGFERPPKVLDPDFERRRGHQLVVEVQAGHHEAVRNQGRSPDQRRNSKLVVCRCLPFTVKKIYEKVLQFISLPHS